MHDLPQCMVSAFPWIRENSTGMPTAESDGRPPAFKAGRTASETSVAIIEITAVHGRCLVTKLASPRSFDNNSVMRAFLAE
jgi:hypothetical protein